MTPLVATIPSLTFSICATAFPSCASSVPAYCSNTNDVDASAEEKAQRKFREEERVPYARVKEGRSFFVVASVVVVVVVLC